MPSKSLDPAALFETATREGIAAFRRAIEAYPGEAFYAFCFYADEDITSVYPTANTVEGLCRITPPGAKDTEYFTWAPAEWDLDFGQYGDSALMRETNALLFPASGEDDTEESTDTFYARKLAAIDALSRALRAIRDSGIFEGHADVETLAFWVNIGDAADPSITIDPVADHLDPAILARLRALHCA